MPLDKSVFKTRAISAVVFGIIMLLALCGTASLFFVVFAAISFIAGKELYAIFCTIKTQEKNDSIQLYYGITCGILFMAIAQFNGYNFITQINAGVNIFFGAVLLMTVLWMAMLKFSRFSITLLLGYVYVSISFGLLALCYTKNWYYPLLLICMIWINDTMQYIVGSIIGKTPMAPTISPKKTWEGTIGGSLLCIICAVVCSFIFKICSTATWITIGLVASIAGTFGDLVESKLKRIAGVKDSGTIMPGHGGALDRFDSLLLAGPVLWFVLQLFF
jgi:phosphatidate cytidylyltransferase